MKLLFVCTGNICRSPTAEGVLRNFAEKEKLPLHIDSAGTHDYHAGEPPDERMQEHAKRRGYDLSGLRARRVTRRDLEEFDLILALDRGHLRILQRMCAPAQLGKIRLLDEGRDVPDPYYGGAEEFERVLDLVEAACRRLLAEIRSAIS